MPRNLLAAGGVFEPDPGNALAPPPSMADAWDVTGPALAQNMRDTYAAASNPQTWQDAADQYRSGMLMGSVAPGPAGRMFYHFTDQNFTKFGGKSRGAVYLADTPEGAVSGGLSGMRERMSSPDEARGPTSADQVPGARTLSVHVPDDLRIYGEKLPDTVTIGERDAALDAADAITHPDPKVAAKAKDLALRLVNSRSQTDLDTQLLDRLYDKYPGYENMSPEDTAAFNAARIRLGPFRHLSDPEFEAPTTQEALKLLGYHGARVADEGGTSLAVMDPSRLSITNPGNPLTANAAPEAGGVGLDAAAMKVLRDMTPSLRAAAASGQPQQ